MDINGAISKEKKENAIDMLVTLVVDELSEDLQMDRDTVLSEFLCSKTGELLYDEDSTLWESGPSYIAEMFRKEIRML